VNASLSYIPSMRVLLLCCLIFLTSVPAWSQPLHAYGLYNTTGKKVKHRNMVKALAKADVILFGELHNNPVAHWLQLKHAQELHANRTLILGAEMLEADDQAVLDAYLRGEIDRKALDTLARLWVNYGTDYAPLVDFAKQHALPFIATNVPRRYASLVYKKGFGALDSLSEKEKAWIAPLPIDYDPELPGYVAMLEMMGGHGGETLPKAQAIKDATMAHFILRNLEQGKVFLHFNAARTELRDCQHRYPARHLKAGRGTSGQGRFHHLCGCRFPRLVLRGTATRCRSSYFGGTGSCPCPPQGWQDRMRLVASQVPFSGPCVCNASTAYAEQVGV